MKSKGDKMSINNKTELFKNSELHFYNELNNFVIKLYSDLTTEKDEMLQKYNKNIELIGEFKSKITNLENDMSYDVNIFNPNYSMETNEKKLQYLKSMNEDLINENNIIIDHVNSLNIKIDEIDCITNELNNKNYKEYLNNCNDKLKIELLRSQEFERKRIAREIHDTVIQKLTSMIHKSEFTLKVMDVDSIRAKLELMTISNNLREVIEEMRNIIYNLRPMAFDDMGIDVIIERELYQIKEKGIDVQYIVEGDNSNVDQIVQITLVRVIQEACNNAVKHSNFTAFIVKIVYNEDTIEVFIKDNGNGFEVPCDSSIMYESKSGFGLSMMRERIYLLSGLIKFDSQKDKGTSIYVKVPKCFREEIKNAD